MLMFICYLSANVEVTKVNSFLTGLNLKFFIKVNLL